MEPYWSLLWTPANGCGTETTKGWLALQHAVHLAQQPAEVVDVGQGVVGDHQRRRTAGDEAEVGQVALMALDADLGPGGGAAQVGDRLGRRVDGDRLGAGEGEGDRVLLAADPELDRPLAIADVAAQTQFAVVGDVAAELDRRRRHADQCGA